VFDSGGNTNDAALLEALLYANRMGAKLTSNSWGGGPPSQSFQDAIYAASHQGALFIAAAGNDGSNIPSYPAAYDCDNIISVAATDHNDQLAGFSNYGAAWVDLGAPGVAILSTIPGGSYAFYDGTSMAAPHASGAAALLWSYASNATSEAVKAAILNSAQPIPALNGKCLTGGRLRLPQALEAVRVYTGAPWLWEEPAQPVPLQVPGHSSVGVTVHYDARVPIAVPGGGTFFGQIHVTSDDPVTNEVTVKADMIVVPVPELHYARQVLDDDTTPPSSGDGDGYAEPGETVEIWVDLVNQGFVTASNLASTFTLVSGTSVTLLSNHPTWPDMDPGQTRRSNTAVLIRVEPSCPVGTKIRLQGVVDDPNPTYGPWTIELTTITVVRVSTIRGFVTDANTSLPIAGATVTANGAIEVTGSASPVKEQAGTGGPPVFREAQTRASAVIPGKARPLVASPETKKDDTHDQGLLGSGGPDAAGYRWIDSDEPGGPVYSWADIRATGTPLPLLGDDEVFGPYPIGFSFPFYGGSYSEYWISTNGWIAFAAPASSNLSNTPLPSPSAPALMIAGLWDDLVVDAATSVTAWSDGAGLFILSMINVKHYSDENRYTFQYILRSNGQILMQYQSLTAPNTDCTVGIQNVDMTIGLTVVCDAGYLHDGLAVKIVRPLPVHGSALTGPDGSYAIHGLPATSYTVSASKGGYSGSIPTTCSVTVPPDRSGVNFRLTSPISDIRPTSFTFNLVSNQKGQKLLRIGNLGSAGLVWRLREVATSGPFHGAVGRLDGTLQSSVGGQPAKLSVKPPTGSPVQPIGGAVQQDKSSAPGRISRTSPNAFSDVLFSYDVQAGSGDNQCLGVEFDGTYFYVTGGNNGADPNKVHVFDAMGNHVRSFDQADSADWGWRDLAFDGTYLYGSDDANVTQVRTDGTFVANLPGPGLGVCRALAYDPAMDHFWSADWNSDIFEFTRTGAVVHSYPNSLQAYGMAWDAVSPGGPWLWVFSQDGPGPAATFSQFDPRLGVYTGVSFIGAGEAADLAGGACFTDRWNPSYGILVGLTQGTSDQIVGYEVCPADAVPWLRESATSGTVAPAGAANITLTADATSMTAGNHYACLLINGNDSRTPVTTITVTMRLSDNTGPTTPGSPVPDKAPFTSRTTVVYRWAPASDPETGVAYYWCQAGTTPGGHDVLDANVGNVTIRSVVGLNGQTLYCRVRAANTIGLAGAWSRNSVGTKIDTTPPSRPAAPRDQGTWTSRTAVTFTWTAATDGAQGSGIGSYDLQVGRWPGASNVFNGNVGPALLRTVTGGANGQTLYARVRARDRAGNVGPWSPNSDGILIDTVPPSRPGTPRDTGAFSSSTTVRFTWTAAVDPGTSASGLGSYRLQVGTGPGAYNILDRNVGALLTATATGAHGQTLYARVCARDRAGNNGSWSGNSDGIAIDTTRPRLTGAVPRDCYAVNLTFNEPVMNADRSSNYTCSRGLAVLGVERLSNASYRLHTSSQTPGTTYSVTVKTFVTDRAGNPMNTSFNSLPFRAPAKTAVRSWELYR